MRKYMILLYICQPYFVGSSLNFIIALGIEAASFLKFCP